MEGDKCIQAQDGYVRALDLEAPSGVLLAHRQIYAMTQNIPVKSKVAGRPLEVRIGVVFFGMPCLKRSQVWERC